MGKKKRRDEEELISRIQAYRKEFSLSLKDKFLKERDERHNNGEVFLKGYWIPKDLVPRLQQELTKRGRIVFFETHLLVLGVIFFTILIWVLFKIFLLP